MKTEYRIQTKGVICMRIGLVAIGVIFSALCLGQASRPRATDAGEKGVVRESKPAAVTDTRSTSGRPADLDPRIPWLEDLGMPQSGGPEPLVKMGEIKLPMQGGLASLAGFGNGVVFVMERRRLPATLFLVDRNGIVEWSRTLTDGIVWKVICDANAIYLVPVAISERARGEVSIIVFDSKGEQAGWLAWPLTKQWSLLERVRIQDRVIVGEDSAGRRIHARIDLKTTVDPESIVTEGDVGIDGEGIDRSEYGREYANGHLPVSVKPGYKGSRGQEKRSVRARNWAGRRLAIGHLPFVGRPESPGHNRPDATINPLWIVKLGDDGSCVVFHQLGNVRGRSWGEYGNTASSGSDDAWMLSEHRSDGSLRSYLILPRNATYFLAGDAVFTPETGKLVRWEHAK